MLWKKPWSLCVNAVSATRRPTETSFNSTFGLIHCVLLVFLGFGFSHPASAASVDNPAPIQFYRYRVLNKLPHDRANFTQGLSFHNGDLFESTGEYGESQVLKYRFPDMQVLARHTLDTRYFGEGLELIGDKVFQLTWKNHTGFVYAVADLSLINKFNYQGEGWGLCSDGQNLYKSNGSAELTVHSPDDFKLLRRIKVTENGRPLTRLNELEWVKGKIYANIWQQNRLVIIDPQSGKVQASVDLSGLLNTAETDRYTDVLNGIAFNPADNSLWVTGKRWPWIFNIELLEIH